LSFFSTIFRLLLPFILPHPLTTAVQPPTDRGRDQTPARRRQGSGTPGNGGGAVRAVLQKINKHSARPIAGGLYK